MKVSAHIREHSKARVSLDGVEMSRLCVGADDKAGWIDLLARNENGQIMLDSGVSPLIERRYGAVTIEL